MQSSQEVPFPSDYVQTTRWELERLHPKIEPSDFEPGQTSDLWVVNKREK